MSGHVAMSVHPDAAEKIKNRPMEVLDQLGMSEDDLKVLGVSFCIAIDSGLNRHESILFLLECMHRYGMTTKAGRG